MNGTQQPVKLIARQTARKEESSSGKMCKEEEERRTGRDLSCNFYSKEGKRVRVGEVCAQQQQTHNSLVDSVKRTWTKCIGHWGRII